MTSGLIPGTDAWHALVDEAAIEPEQRMVDAHHHLWPDSGPLGYGLVQLRVGGDELLPLATYPKVVVALAPREPL